MDHIKGRNAYHQKNQKAPKSTLLNTNHVKMLRATTLFPTKNNHLKTTNIAIAMPPRQQKTAYLLLEKHFFCHHPVPNGTNPPKNNQQRQHPHLHPRDKAPRPQKKYVSKKAHQKNIRFVIHYITKQKIHQKRVQIGSWAILAEEVL